jgi:4-amino-4-deoxy-L-arabinose transferase-like glycosyltransferase
MVEQLFDPPLCWVIFCPSRNISMERRSSTIYRQLGLTTHDRRIDPLWMLFFAIAGGVLYTWQLGDLPLGGGTEGTVAVVARQIWRSTWEQGIWLFPQNIDGTPYRNQPPLMYWLISLAYSLGGVSEMTTRLPSALLSAFSVPLLYWVGREMFYRRLPAIFAAAVYLTYLPVVRQGRLAMLDGAVLCFLLLMWGCLLRSRRDLRWSLGIGVSIGLISLTQSWQGLLLGAIGLVFLLWDTPRIMRSLYVWGGLLLGVAPAIAWYGLQYAKYGMAVFQAPLPAASNAEPVWFYLVEMIKYGTIWLIFLPLGLRLLGRDWHLSWARLLTVWFGGYFLSISLMPTKLPWDALPLYPPIALLIGFSLTHLWEPDRRSGIRIPAHRWWASGLLLLAGIASNQLADTLLKGGEWDLVLVWGTLAATLLAASLTVWQQSRQFILVLIWGAYLTLIGLMRSDNWMGELAPPDPVKPIAALVKAHTPIHQPVYAMIGPRSRASLEFYTDRPLIPLSLAQLEALPIAPTGLTLLLSVEDRAIIRRRHPKSVKPIAKSGHWTIVQVKP